MIIDCHGHYTTAPKQLQEFRDAQLAGSAAQLAPISDDELRESVETNQLRILRERGGDLMIFSPEGVGDGAPRARPRDGRRLGAGEQRPRRPGGRALPGQLRRRLPAAADPGRIAGRRRRGAAPLRRGARLRRRQPQPRPVRRLLDLPADDRPVLVPGLRGAGRARRAGDGARVELVQPELPRPRRALPQRRHLGVHAAARGRPVRALPDAAAGHPARRRGGPVPLGPLPGAGDAHGPAGPVDAAAQRLLRHLRLPPAGHRPADPRDPDREHPVRLRDARRRARRGPGDRHRLGRHEDSTSTRRA